MNEMIRRAAWLAFAGILAFALGLAPLSAQEATTPKDRLEALVERMRKTTKDYYGKNLKDDLTEEQRDAVIAKRPGLEFIPEFETLAGEAKGTDVAASARMESFSIQCAFQKKEDAAKTLERLLAESIGSRELKSLPTTLMYSYGRLAGQEKAIATLEKLLEKSPHPEVKASSLFTLGQVCCGKKSSDVQKAKGRKCFERLIAEFGALKSYQGTYKEAAESFLFELDHLQIGMQAPDFETIDENGTKFKLSDYRGKVMVIDFWGNW